MKKSKQTVDKSIIVKIVAAVIVVGAIAYGFRSDPTEAAVLPPGGDSGPAQIYVNNVSGSDDGGDGSMAAPYASITKAIAAANVSPAMSVRVNVAGTKQPYLLQSDLSTARDGIELANYGKRPYVMGKSVDGGLTRLEITGTTNTKITGFDFVDVGLFVQGAQSLLVKENRFAVQDTSLFEKYNNSAAINAASLNGDPKSNQDLIFDGNHIWVQKPNAVRMTAIRLDGAYVAQVYDNMFTPGAANGIRALLETVSAEDVKMNGNRFDRPYNSGALYLMSQTKDGQVFDYKPAYE